MSSHTQCISLASRSASQLNSIDELTDAELIKLVKELKQQIRILVLENEILEKTMTRYDPTLLVGTQQALEYANKLHSNSTLGMGSFVRSQSSRFGALDSFNSPSRMLTSASKASTRMMGSSAKFTILFASGPRVNVLERSELVSTEMGILVEEMARARTKAAKQQALFKAQLEEIGLRVIDIEKASISFKQQVIVEGWDKIAQRIPAEIWIKYMTEWAKIADSIIGKLRLRTSTLNTQYSKLKGQIKVKADLSESLRPVDFEKLKIENNECMEIIDKKLQQLAELKKMTGDANLNLTIHKKAMMEQNAYLTKILKTVKDRERTTIELEKERDVIKVEADSLDQKLEDVRKVRLAYEVPDVMDYVRVKSEVADLKHSVKLLENRVHIQKIALTSLNKKLNSMFQS